MNSAKQTGAWRVAVSEWRAHWRVGIAAMLGAGVSFSIWPAVSSLFVAPLQATFGWSRGDIALAQNASLAAHLTVRELALAITRSGLAISSAILPPLVFMVIAAYGWRAGHCDRRGGAVGVRAGR